MSVFATLRALGLIRRAVRALESLARSQSSLAEIAQQRVTRIAERKQRRASPRKIELGFMDTQEIERRYQERLKQDLVERE
jgi:hypothetical protein